jgi:uncharacterized membrane protein YedE/YeeE
MDIVVNPDAWLHALAGGGMIGLAAAMLLLFSGRIAGISGVLGGLIYERKTGDMSWRMLFLAGLVLGGFAFLLIGNGPALSAAPLGWPLTILAGALVGFGTRLGNGCTSGHGICGMARFSRRSFVATLTFMSFGFITVFVVRHLAGQP